MCRGGEDSPFQGAPQSLRNTMLEPRHPSYSLSGTQSMMITLLLVFEISLFHVAVVKVLKLISGVLRRTFW